MSTRLLEDCFNIGLLEEERYTKYISLSSSNTTILIVDPYMININDLRNLKPGKVMFVRARRPAWGYGDLHRFIHKIEVP